MRRGSIARVIEPRGAQRQGQAPPLRLLPRVEPRARGDHAPGVILHPDEIMNENRKVLDDLLEILSEVRAGHALIGGLAAGCYGRDRATVDVDLLVSRRSMKRLTAAIVRRGYGVEVSEDMIRAHRAGTSIAVADLLAREAHPVLLAASAATRRAVILGLPVNVVRRGAFVALKYHAAISPTRAPHDRYQDVADLASVVARGFGPDDERLASTIVAGSYPGAREEFRVLVDDLRHGRPIKI